MHIFIVDEADANNSVTFSTKSTDLDYKIATGMDTHEKQWIDIHD